AGVVAAPIVVGERRPPEAVVAVDPCQRAAVDAEAVGVHVLHRLRVEHLDRALHRPFGIVGVGGVQPRVHHDSAVQVFDRAVLVADELQLRLAGRPVDPSDLAVVHSVDVLAVDGDALVGVPDVVVDPLDRRGVFGRFGRCTGVGRGGGAGEDYGGGESVFGVGY